MTEYNKLSDIDGKVVCKICNKTLCTNEYMKCNDNTIEIICDDCKKEHRREAWKLIKFSEIKKGDIIRLYENDTPVKDTNGNEEFKVISDAYTIDGDIWIFDSECE